MTAVNNIDNSHIIMSRNDRTLTNANVDTLTITIIANSHCCHPLFLLFKLPKINTHHAFSNNNVSGEEVK